MRRSLSLTLPAAIALIAGLLFAGSGAQAADNDTVQYGPPTDAACLPLIAGRTGLIGLEGVPTLSSLIGQSAWGQAAPAALALPDRIWFKDASNTVSARYAFALRDGRLYARPAKNGVGDAGSTWRQVKLPACLDGKITAISADSNLLLALGPGRQLYSHNMPGGDLAPERWTWRWGPYLWTGLGTKLPKSLTDFATSDFSAPATFTDIAGRAHQPIGVATLYLLADNGRRLTYLDPWLPADESREVCLPAGGTAAIAGMDATRSTVAVVTKSGQIHTRLYDFDVTGANPVFGEYTWDDNAPANSTAWQLPVRDWTRQPQPPGKTTDRITILSTGNNPGDQQLHVEGWRGTKSGVWTKKLNAKTWSFTRTTAAVAGNSVPRAAAKITPATQRYLGTMGGKPAEISSFNWACTPTTVRVEIANGLNVDLTLWAYDGFRQANRAKGLDDHPREYNAAIEVPRVTWSALPKADPRLRSWIEQHLDGRITVSPISVTSTRLRFLKPCWDLTLNGKPARADALPIPPDPGVLLGRLKQAQQDNRLPGSCFVTSLPLG